MAGALLGVVDLGKFAAEFVDPVKVGATGYVYVCDRDGTFLAHPKKELILKNKVTEWDFGQKIMAEGNGVIAYNFKGKDRQSAFARSEKLGWVSAVALDESQIYAASNRLRNFGIILTLVSVLVVGGIVFFVARSVTRPHQRDDHRAERRLRADHGGRHRDRQRERAAGQPVQRAGGGGRGDLGEPRADGEQRHRDPRGGRHLPAAHGRLAQGGAAGPGLDDRDGLGHRHHQGQFRCHGAHCRHHRRHRLPDEPAGTQCRGGSRARRRGGQGLRRGGRGSAQPGAARRRGRTRDVRTDREVGAARQPRRAGDGRRPRVVPGHGAQRRAGGHAGRRHREGRTRAGHRHRPDQHRHAPARPDHAGRGRHGRGNGGGGRGTERAVGAVARDRGPAAAPGDGRNGDREPRDACGGSGPRWAAFARFRRPAPARTGESGGARLLVTRSGPDTQRGDLRRRKSPSPYIVPTGRRSVDRHELHRMWLLSRHHAKARAAVGTNIIRFIHVDYHLVGSRAFEPHDVARPDAAFGSDRVAGRKRARLRLGACRQVEGLAVVIKPDGVHQAVAPVVGIQCRHGRLSQAFGKARPRQFDELLFDRVQRRVAKPGQQRLRHVQQRDLGVVAHLDAVDHLQQRVVLQDAQSPFGIVLVVQRDRHGRNDQVAVRRHQAGHVIRGVAEGRFAQQPAHGVLLEQAGRQRGVARERKGGLHESAQDRLHVVAGVVDVACHQPSASRGPAPSPYPRAIAPSSSCTCATSEAGSRNRAQAPKPSTSDITSGSLVDQNDSRRPPPFRSASSWSGLQVRSRA